MTELEKQGAGAKEAARVLAVASTAVKNAALEAIAAGLLAGQDAILAANAEDMDAARTGGMAQAMLDRLALTPARIAGMADGVRQVAALPDPIGVVDRRVERPNGLVIERRRVPLGVIAIIFEARPNVTSDAAALCLKSGNAVILRGGKEAAHSCRAIADVMRRAVASAGLPENCINLVADTSRESAAELMRLRDYVNVLIPRGGAGLIRATVENARVPVIETGVGNCHVYVDGAADLQMAADIIYNAKCSRPSVCNAAETLLVDRRVAQAFLPMAKARLDEKHTQLRGCPETRAILGDCVVPATEADYASEFGDYILAVKVISGLDEALAHIAKYSTGHSECIVTEDRAAAEKFMDNVDAAAVYHNASTRFTDGGEFGLGAEIGISTQKLHARGPMGLEQLTSVKYTVYGTGQVR